MRISDLASIIDALSEKIRVERESLGALPRQSLDIPSGKLQEHLKANEIAIKSLLQLQNNSIDSIKSSDIAIDEMKNTLAHIGKIAQNNHQAVEELKNIIEKNRSNLKASSDAMSAINRMVYDDELTGLPNRRILNDRLRKLVASNKRWESYSAVLFIDLDKFKSLNDEYGHETGDDVLKEVAIRLKTAVRETDTVARYGGDEFVILLEKLNGNLPDARQEADLVAQKILLCFKPAINVKNKIDIKSNKLTEIQINASIGIAMLGGDFNQLTTVIDHADSAMYSAKKSGGRTYKFYDVQDSLENKLLALYNLSTQNDIETLQHGLRTRQYVKLLAKRAHELNLFPGQLNNQVIDRLYKTTQLHDIGKTKIPQSILHKKKKLTSAESKIMQTHPSRGVEILEEAKEQNVSLSQLLSTAIELAGNHHENWDGSGYPQGLSGNAIPLAGRIMAIADVYDALVNCRDYKSMVSHEEAMAEIVANAGKKFDPLLVEVLLDQQNNFREISQSIKDEMVLH